MAASPLSVLISKLLAQLNVAHHHPLSRNLCTIASGKDRNVAMLNLLSVLSVKTRINQQLAGDFSL